MSKLESEETKRPETVVTWATRRGFLLMGLGLLAGCGKTTSQRVMLPNPPWPSLDVRPAPTPSVRVPPKYEPPTDPKPVPSSPWESTLVARRDWARGTAIPKRMDRMAPIRYITVHHDGMNSFNTTDRRSTAGRLELIRKAHRGRGWGDIGYHFAVDRAGRIWEGRSLSFQGAHVKDRNYANIGVVALGNFDLQQPSQAQLAAVRLHVSRLMKRFDVPTNRVYTHQEWAPTACPGRYLQRFMTIARRQGQLS